MNTAGTRTAYRLTANKTKAVRMQKGDTTSPTAHRGATTNL